MFIFAMNSKWPNSPTLSTLNTLTKEKVKFDVFCSIVFNLFQDGKDEASNNSIKVSRLQSYYGIQQTLHNIWLVRQLFIKINNGSMLFSGRIAFEIKFLSIIIQTIPNGCLHLILNHSGFIVILVSYYD